MKLLPIEVDIGALRHIPQVGPHALGSRYGDAVREHPDQLAVLEGAEEEAARRHATTQRLEAETLEANAQAEADAVKLDTAAAAEDELAEDAPSRRLSRQHDAQAADLRAQAAELRATKQVRLDAVRDAKVRAIQAGIQAANVRRRVMESHAYLAKCAYVAQMYIARSRASDLEAELLELQGGES